jgi:hypothetical protein
MFSENTPISSAISYSSSFQSSSAKSSMATWMVFLAYTLAPSVTVTAFPPLGSAIPSFMTGGSLTDLPVTPMQRSSRESSLPSGVTNFVHQ